MTHPWHRQGPEQAVTMCCSHKPDWFRNGWFLPLCFCPGSQNLNLILQLHVRALPDLAFDLTNGFFPTSNLFMLTISFSKENFNAFPFVSMS